MNFDQLLKLVTPTLHQVAFFNNLNKQDSEDVIQETLLSLWKKWSSGKIDSSQNIVGYASQLMNWRARDRNRKLVNASNNSSLPNEDNDLDQLPSPIRPKKDKLEILILAAKDTKKLIKKRDYEIFADYFLHGKDISETAKRLKLDNNTVYLVRCRVAKKVVINAQKYL